MFVTSPVWKPLSKLWVGFETLVAHKCIAEQFET